MDVFRKVLPALLLAFGWAYAASKLPVLKAWLPRINDFSGGGFTLLTFVGIYLVARLCRYYEVEKMLNMKRLMLIAVASGGMCWIGMGHYHSPFAVVFAGAMFFLFKRIPIDRIQWLSRMILWLSASTFSIYLLHRNAMGMSWMRHVEDIYIAERGCNYYAVCIYCAIVFFFGALALDLPRRLAVWALAKVKHSVK